LSFSIEQFRSEGNLETRGHFRLDEKAARDKLRQFRLKDPHAWVLELVRAAHLGKAESISFTIRAGEMSCQIRGLELPKHLVKDWAHAPFQELDSLEAKVLRHVAIGVVTLQGLGPKRIAFEAGSGSDRIRIEIEDGQERQTSSRESGIWVESEGKFVHGIKRFFESIFGELAEVSHLKRSCKYPEVHVFLNGDRIGSAMQIHSDIVVPIQSSLEAGVLGLRDFGVQRLGVHQHGILLEEIVEDVVGVWKGFEALVVSTRVKTDLGGQRIVRDKSFLELQALVQSAWIRAVEVRVQDQDFPGRSKFVREMLETVEMTRVRDGGIPVDLQRLADRLDHIPVWPQMVGHDVNYVSVEDLSHVPGRRLHYVTRGYPDSSLRAGEVILLARRERDVVWIEDVSIRTLEHRLNRKMYDMTGELRDREEAALNQERWRRSPVEESKLTGMMATHAFGHHVGDRLWRVEIGFGVNIGGAQSTWIKEGRLLSRHRVLGLDIAIMIRGDIPPNRIFAGADPRSKQVRSVVLRVMEETLELAIGVLQGRVRTSDTLDLTSSRLKRLAIDVVKAGINGELTDLLVRALGLEVLKEKDIGYSARIAAGISTTMTAEQRIEALGPILDLPLYWRGSSLVSLNELIQSSGRISFEIANLTQMTSANISTIASGGQDVLFISKADERGLIRILGGRLEVRVQARVKGTDRTKETLRLLNSKHGSARAVGTSADVRTPIDTYRPVKRDAPAAPPAPPESMIRHNEPFLDSLAEWILSKCDVVFGEPNIRGLRYVSRGGRQVGRVVEDHVEIDTTHAIVELAMKHPDDLILRGMLGSSVYTVVNCHFLSVQDHHERNFLAGVIDKIGLPLKREQA